MFKNTNKNSPEALGNPVRTAVNVNTDLIGSCASSRTHRTDVPSPPIVLKVCGKPSNHHQSVQHFYNIVWLIGHEVDDEEEIALHWGCEYCLFFCLFDFGWFLVGFVRD